MPDTSNHNISLTPDLGEAIERRIASGNYASQSAVIRAALRALEVVEQEQAARLRDLDAAIARAIADAETGRLVPADDAFARIRKELGLTGKDRDQ